MSGALVCWPNPRVQVRRDTARTAGVGSLLMRDDARFRDRRRKSGIVWSLRGTPNALPISRGAKQHLAQVGWTELDRDQLIPDFDPAHKTVQQCTLLRWI